MLAQTTPARARNPFVQFLHRMKQRLTPKDASLRNLTDAQARDIGLDPATLERLRHTHPSFQLRHPRL